MLLLGAESFVFQFAVQKFKDENIQNYNFLCFLYGCENWSLTLREERRMSVLENRALGRIFGLKKDEEIGEGRNYYNE